MNSKGWLGALCIGFVAAGCGQAPGFEEEETEQADGAIVGGFELPVAVPYLVALYYQLGEESGPICGGSLIGPAWVMTAAHCVLDSEGSVVPAEALSVVFHEANLADVAPNHRVAISNVIVHPDYAESGVNDIALLKLKKPLRRTETIPYDRRDTLQEGTVALALGWGVTEPEELPQAEPEPPPEPELTPESAGEVRKYYAAASRQRWIPSDLGGSDQLRGVFLKALSNEDCDARMSEGLLANGYGEIAGLITPDMVCAGPRRRDEHKDTCYGDSGGPLLAFDWRKRQLVVAGITSWGFGCGDLEFPGVYHRVSTTADFIRHHTGI